LKKVAIMQPTYLPWVGYFALMDRVDVFVLFDSVQFARRSWQQRNQIKSVGVAKFLTVPIKKSGLRDQLISETEINSDENALDKHVRIIEADYKAAPFFKKYGPGLFDILTARPSLLADLNIQLILFLKEALGIETEIIRSSTLKAAGTKADLLADICQQLEADQYISPPGSKEYMAASSAFLDRNIDVLYQDYQHPDYRQLHGDFVPYMSVIDLLFNEGPASRNIMINGIR
jgi:hypothetical protein